MAEASGIHFNEILWNLTIFFSCLALFGNAIYRVTFDDNGGIGIGVGWKCDQTEFFLLTERMPYYGIRGKFMESMFEHNHKFQVKLRYGVDRVLWQQTPVNSYLHIRPSTQPIKFITHFPPCVCLPLAIHLVIDSILNAAPSHSNLI